MCPANEKRSQDKRESLENGHEVLSSMFSEMQQAKVLYNTLESVGEVKESSDVILQHLKESSEKISDGMRIHEENMKKIERAVEAQNQRIEELHKALNQILNIVKEKAEKESWGGIPLAKRLRKTHLRSDIRPGALLHGAESNSFCSLSASAHARYRVWAGS